jgi:hypothetical protein
MIDLDVVPIVIILLTCSLDLIQQRRNWLQSEEENASSYCEHFSEINTLRDRPFNLQGGL